MQKEPPAGVPAASSFRPPGGGISWRLRLRDGRTADSADVLAVEVDYIVRVAAEDAGGEILGEHDVGTVNVDLKGIPLSDVQGPAQLDGEHDPAQFVHLPHDTGCFHDSFSFLVQSCHHFQGRAHYNTWYRKVKRHFADFSPISKKMSEMIGLFYNLLDFPQIAPTFSP